MLAITKLQRATALVRETAFQRGLLLPAVQSSSVARTFASGDEGIKPDNFLKKLQQIGLRELTEITSKYEGLRTDVRSADEKEAEDSEEVQNEVKLHHSTLYIADHHESRFPCAANNAEIPFSA